MLRWRAMSQGVARAHAGADARRRTDDWQQGPDTSRGSLRGAALCERLTTRARPGSSVITSSGETQEVPRSHGACSSARCGWARRCSVQPGRAAEAGAGPWSSSCTIHASPSCLRSLDPRALAASCCGGGLGRRRRAVMLPCGGPALSDEGAKSCAAARALADMQRSAGTSLHAGKQHHARLGRWIETTRRARRAARRVPACEKRGWPPPRARWAGPRRVRMPMACACTALCAACTMRC